ncbi:hypothetical protein H072_4272 [Dactylellina haptotyla CBS 200.50]|uniref:Uncharacterized protein n=1 Tax=Dactylellina haptotyla (strain CBS 200.50) TaxID=1284197 RepID=S8AFI0_DACHA|nr:hypothetical protein H072_4272 [Dactylellina haptotyla CBS 200.50]
MPSSFLLAALLAAVAIPKGSLAQVDSATTSISSYIVVTEFYNHPKKYSTSYTTDTYTITACDAAGPATSDTVDCKLRANAGDVFVVFSNATVTSTFTDSAAYSAFSSSIVNIEPTKSSGYAINGTSIIFLDNVNGTEVQRNYPCCQNDIFDELNVTISYTGPKVKYSACPTISIRYLVPEQENYITLEAGRHINDKNWKPFINGSSCASSRTKKGVVTRTPIVLVLKTAEPTTTTTHAEAASTVESLPTETGILSSSSQPADITTPSSSAVEELTSSSSIATSEAEPDTSSSTSFPTSEVSVLPSVENFSEPETIPITSRSSTATTSSFAASETMSVSLSTSDTNKQSSSTSQSVTTSEVPTTAVGTGLSGETTTTVTQSKSSISSATSSEFPSLSFGANSTAEILTPKETAGAESSVTPNFLRFAQLSVSDQSLDLLSESESEWPSFLPAGANWWDWWRAYEETVVYTWVGPQMYVPPKFIDGKWYDQSGSIMDVPDDWIVWGEKIQWPPFVTDDWPIGTSSRTKGAVSTPVKVKTQTGRTTIHTTQNGKPTDIVSSFTSLITEPPIRPSISTSLETSSFVTSIGGKPTTTSVVITHAFAIGPSSTTTSVGTSFVQTVIDGKTTMVPMVFTTTMVNPGETFSLFGRVTTVSTTINGTTAVVTLSLIAGSLVSAGGMPATNEAGFTTVVENNDGITYVVTNGVTKTLAVSGSIIDSSAFPPMTSGPATRAGKAIRGTFVTEVAGKTGTESSSAESTASGGGGGGDGATPSSGSNGSGERNAASKSISVSFIWVSGVISVMGLAYFL